jgi:chaperonin GroEL
VLAVKAPGYGDKKKEMLADIAAVVGAQVISSDTGMTFENATLAMLGKARACRDQGHDDVRGRQGQEGRHRGAREAAPGACENTTSSFDKEKLEERIAKLTGGVAVIRVGAATETEMKYLKDKIDDAVKATKASIEEGIVPGGGTALAKAAKKLDEGMAKKKLSDDELNGFNTVVRALEQPLLQIAFNAGKEKEATAS